jgi:hypothetical protein
MDIWTSLKLRFSRKSNRKRYAVEVGTDEAEELKIPHTKILERWSNSNETVMMIVESSADLAAVAGGLPGVRGIRKV